MEIKPDIIFNIGPFGITNTFLSCILLTFFLIFIAYKYSKNIKLIPDNFQNIIEFILEFMFNTAKEITQSEKKTKDFFPLIGTFFLFILLGNYFGLTPLFHNIGFINSNSHNVTPLLRPFTSDLNATLSLALISVIATQYYAIKYVGFWGNILRYLSFNPILLFVGVLEIVSELIKPISLSLRLFGNIFAGDIVIENFSHLFAIFLPLPFMGLETIVGFVQATVFAILTLAFTNILTEKNIH